MLNMPAAGHLGRGLVLSIMSALDIRLWEGHGGARCGRGLLQAQMSGEENQRAKSFPCSVYMCVGMW